MNKNRQNKVLFTVCLGFFMVILDATIVNVALPSIARGFNSNTSDLQWIMVGYTLSFASLLLLAGHLTDRIGAKQTLTMGLIGFLITSLACGLAPNILTLTLFRILQGASATALIPASLSLINATFLEAKQRAKAIGLWGSMGGIAAASGPMIGALLTAALSWRAVFLVNVPIALFAALLLHYTIDTTQRTPQTMALDWLGQLLAVSFVFFLALILIEFGRMGWDSLMIKLSSIVTVLSLLLFIIVEKRVKHPLIPLTFFKSNSFSVSIVTGLIINCGLYGMLFLLPLYFSKVRHYTVTQIGFAVLPLLVLVAIASYFSGKTIGHSGPRKAILIGLMVGALGFLSLYLVTKGALPYYWLITPLAAIGFGVAFTMPAATYSAIHSVSEQCAGIASSTFTTGRQMGSLLGVAVFGSIAASKTSFLEGFQMTLLIAAILFSIGFMLNVLLKNFLKQIVNTPRSLQ